MMLDVKKNIKQPEKNYKKKPNIFSLHLTCHAKSISTSKSLINMCELYIIFTTKILDWSNVYKKKYRIYTYLDIAHKIITMID